MKIISYNLELDEERKPMLVKDFMCDYDVMHPDPESIYKMMSEVFSCGPARGRTSMAYLHEH